MPQTQARTNSPEPTHVTHDIESFLLNKQQAALYLGVTPRWMTESITLKRIPYVKLGHYVRFKRSDLDDYINANTVAAGSA